MTQDRQPTHPMNGPRVKTDAVVRHTRQALRHTVFGMVALVRQDKIITGCTASLVHHGRQDQSQDSPRCLALLGEFKACRRSSHSLHHCISISLDSIPRRAGLAEGMVEGQLKGSLCPPNTACGPALKNPSSADARLTVMLVSLSFPLQPNRITDTGTPPAHPLCSCAGMCGTATYSASLAVTVARCRIPAKGT